MKEGIIMPMLEDMLSRGYFPKELPPCFRTETYAKAMMDDSRRPNEFTDGKKSARACIHNLARAGSLRRKLHIVNPVAFFPLAKCIADNWNVLDIMCKRSYLSKSLPVIDQRLQRAIIASNIESDLTENRSHIRAPQYFIVKTDIANFYPSIYTHSIPWAIHGKATAKAQKRNLNLLGNKIDTLLRNCQDGQTMGIPVGPDISLVLAETVLSAIDETIAAKLNRQSGIRFYDDYEFTVDSAVRANEILAALQESLSEYELTLNPNKTYLKNLPHELEPSWVHQIRTFEFRQAAGQKADIIKFFDLLFDLIRAYPTCHVVKYALARFYWENLGGKLTEGNWPILQSLIVQACMAECGGLASAYRIILEQSKHGQQVNLDLLRTMMVNKVKNNVPSGHSSEIAWVLWGAIAFKIKLEANVGTLITSMTDSLVGILALDACTRNLLDLTETNTLLWESYMQEDELYGSQWLLAYESCHRGWTNSFNLSADPAFGFLHNQNVSFYEPISADPLLSLEKAIDSTSRQDLYPVFQPPANLAGYDSIF